MLPSKLLMQNLFISLFYLFALYLCFVHAAYLGVYPTGCDIEAALVCENKFLNCKLFTGPADDADTLCQCGENFYGECLRKAGCETAPQVDELSTHQIYMKLCVQHIIKNDCASPLMCSTNCASEGVIDPAMSKVIPFNNYGSYYLRIRICQRKVHANKLSKYAFIDAVSCDKLEDFSICTRWIPPQTFVPVALPIDTTYIEVDSCTISTDKYGDIVYFCHKTDPPPSRIYGNRFIFPSTFDVAQTNVSICSIDDDCLGSRCEKKFNPKICSPKTLRHVQNSGRYYLSDPFG